MRIRSSILLVTLFAAAATAAVAAEAPQITVGDLGCLPDESNTALTATVSPEVAGTSTRLYFRRLNPVGAFYFDEMISAAAGSYWTVFPKPEEREQQQLTDEWWEVLKDRDWMEDRDREWLEDWLEAQEHEAAEYFVAVHSADGERLSRSDLRLVEVRDREDCPTELTPHQIGWAGNLTVGETTEIQEGKQVFHWLCDGIVTRMSSEGILRADDFCRACVVGLLPRLTPTAAVAAGIVGVSIIEHPASPTQPPPGQ